MTCSFAITFLTCKTEKTLPTSGLTVQKYLIYFKHLAGLHTKLLSLAFSLPLPLRVVP